MAQNDDKYNDPRLRDGIKEKIHAEDRGGKPGQWSARKAQLLAAEYKQTMEECGKEAYKTDKSEQSESQKSLSDWGKEDWQTSDGSATARQEDGTEKRYLPRKAWEGMTEEEKRETDERKIEGSRQGKQYVGNTAEAKEARKKVHEASDGEDEPRRTKHKLDEDADRGNGEEQSRSELEAGENRNNSNLAPAAKIAKNNRGTKKVTKKKPDNEVKTDTKQVSEMRAKDEGDDDAEYTPSGSECNEFEFELVSSSNEELERD